MHDLDGQGQAPGNGAFAQKLIMAKLGEMHTDIKDIRKKSDDADKSLSLTNSRLNIVEMQVRGLPCDRHTSDMAELKDALRTRLGWKALVVAALPALAAGVMAGARFL